MLNSGAEIRCELAHDGTSRNPVYALGTMRQSSVAPCSCFRPCLNWPLFMEATLAPGPGRSTIESEMASRAGTCDRRWCPGRRTIAARAGVGENERGSARLRSVQAACMGQKARAVNVIIANRRTDPRRPASADLARTAAPCTEDLPTSSRPEPRTPLATAGRSGPRTHLATAERELAVPGAKDAPPRPGAVPPRATSQRMHGKRRNPSSVVPNGGSARPRPRLTTRVPHGTVTSARRQGLARLDRRQGTPCPPG